MLSVLVSLILCAGGSQREAAPSAGEHERAPIAGRDPFASGGVVRKESPCGTRWCGLDGLENYRLTGIIRAKGQFRAAFEHRSSKRTVTVRLGSRFRNAEVTKISGSAVELHKYRGPCPEEQLQDQSDVVIRLEEHVERAW